MFQTAEGVIKPIVYVGIIKDGKLLLVKYRTAPNPEKRGWWIPAPGLAFGEAPDARARQVVAELGLALESLELAEVESLNLPGGWHLMTHYRARVSGEPAAHANVEETRWVDAAELAALPDVAHGRWEVQLGRKLLA